MLYFATKTIKTQFLSHTCRYVAKVYRNKILLSKLEIVTYTLPGVICVDINYF